MTDHFLESTWQQTRGAIGRELDADDRLVFQFDTVGWRLIHMLGVRQPLVVAFYQGDEQMKQTRLRPWVGAALGKADRVVERPIGGQA